MTAQASEILIYKGLEFQILSEPLEDYLRNYNNLPPFEFTSTGCWRGYIGKWEIKNDKLFLVGLEANTLFGSTNLDYLFPNKTEVFADWFNGELKIAHGEMIEYSHRGHFSIYEQSICLQFINGLIVDQKIIDNKTGLVYLSSFSEFLDNSIKNEINSYDLDKLIEMFDSDFRQFAGELYEQFRKIDFKDENDNFVKVNLRDWEVSEKKSLFAAALKGLNMYYFVLTNRSSFPVASFNNIMNAIAGNDTVYINKKSIKWFPNDIKVKLKSQNINFPDFPPKKNYYNDDSYDNNDWLIDAAGTDDPETMNDVYWNLD